jgi:hypothetical protein
MAFLMTRINVGDYDAWKPTFDEERPGGARAASKGWRLFRNVDDPGEVFIQVEFGSVEEAKAARERLLASGVLDPFSDKSEPKVVEIAEEVSR